MSKAEVLHGDCLDVLKTLEKNSVDAVVTDPPYPCIKRSYGYWTEEQWFALINPVVEQCRRVLKPTGSAVFILQPNSERVGRMRTWLWEFMAKWGKEWGIVQDAYWWNYTALPLTGANPNGLRPSVKPCVWFGESSCYRQSNDSLWDESTVSRACRENARMTNRLQKRAGGQTMRDDRARTACIKRGGVTPFNLMPVGADGKDGKHKHPGKTPLDLCRWWTRYICPANGVLLDPFAGSGTTGVAAIQEGRQYIGIERMPEYVEIARQRIAVAQAETPLFAEGNP